MTEIYGVSVTDGVAVSVDNLPEFPFGVHVVQDGAGEVAPERTRNTQNFKIVDQRRVSDLLYTPYHPGGRLRQHETLLYLADAAKKPPKIGRNR